MFSATLSPAIEAFHNIPQKELYRLIVDGKLHKKQTERGWFGYAMREKNSLPSAFNALQFALTNLDDKKISTDLIKEIHARATKNVDRVCGVPGQFRTHPVGYNFDLKEGNVNEGGLKDLYDFAISDSNNHSCIVASKTSEELFGFPKSQEEWDVRVNSFNQELSYDELWNAIEEKQFVLYRAVSHDRIDTMIESCCEHFNQALQETNSSEEMLKLIALTVRTMYQTHPFDDANTRICLILLQRLLVQNGFLPVMMYQPNQLGGFCLDSLVAQIKEGMEVTKKSILNPNEPLFNYVTVKVKPKEIDIYDAPEIIRLRVAQNEAIEKYYQAEKTLYQFLQTFNQQSYDDNDKAALSHDSIGLEENKPAISNTLPPPLPVPSALATHFSIYAKPVQPQEEEERPKHVQPQEEEERNFLVNRGACPIM